MGPRLVAIDLASTSGSVGSLGMAPRAGGRGHPPKLGMGDSVEFSCEPGPHRLWIKLDFKQSNTIDFTVHADGTARFECEPGGPYLWRSSIYSGRASTSRSFSLGRIRQAHPEHPQCADQPRSITVTVPKLLWVLSSPIGGISDVKTADRPMTGHSTSRASSY